VTRSRSAERFLWLLSFGASLAFATWQTLLNNFAVEQAGFGGVEIGILQSLREVPGFLAFTTVFVLLFLREQTFVLLSVALLGLGVALTGFFPQEYTFYLTTILMSVGFHYFFTLQKSLVLQWIEVEHTPVALGRLSAARSYAAILVFAAIWLGLEFWHIGYQWLYLPAGGATILLALWAWRSFPRFSHQVPQHKHLLMRRRYWLYYALTFMGGARRQIFVVFAGFLMVEKFGYGASDIALLFLVNHLINTWAAPRVGRLVAQWGERRALTLEYIGLIVIFSSYAFVEVAWLAGLLYVLDHLLFAMAIAIESYFKKIADPRDFASTAGVSFTINHIAAVVIPVIFGFVWMESRAAVFLMGAVMAVASLLLARLVPAEPADGMETRFAQ
jgi:predicted MFS family arabinose efflux permease